MLALDAASWAILLSAALLVGFSKTGLPGSGIVAVPMLAAVFGGRLSVGTALPLLISADCFAVYYYRKEARFDHLGKLLPWVSFGLVIGTVALFSIGDKKSVTDPLNPIIGSIVLIMLLLGLLRGKLGDKLVPHSKWGTRATGALAGFTTMVSNAAGPIMQIYLVATEMKKEELMGTTALYFFTVNVIKIPFYFALSAAQPNNPMWSLASLATVACGLPLLVMGALLGRRFAGAVPQAVFNKIVLFFAALGGIYLILK